MTSLKESVFGLIDSLITRPSIPQDIVTDSLMKELFLLGEAWSKIFIQQLEKHMEDTDMIDSLDYQYALKRISRYLKGEAEPEEPRGT